jgi:NAD(P)-dependent dehydrogenase (short-subunit alcohol dehydrogenase family)
MKAIILGAKEGSGNIGDVLARELLKLNWDVVADDCSVPANLKGTVLSGHSFDIPPLGEHADAESLVVTLGATAIERFDETSEWDIENIVRGCLLLPILAVKEYVSVRGDQGGRVILTGSYAHRHPFTSGTAYCAAKAGLEMATRTLAWELTERGFYFNVIHPYHVEGTPMWESVQTGVMRDRGWSRKDADEYAMKDRKLDRLMTPDDFAKVAIWLMTSEVVPQLSGSNIEMFGGTR